MANIDIAGKLNAATAEGYVAEANQIHYAGGNGNVEDALESTKTMKTSVDDLNKNGRNWYRYGAVRASQLFALTTSATSDDVKAALTDIQGNDPKQAGLDACITGRMRLCEYTLGGTVMVGWSGQGYILTYVGQLTPASDVYACTITVSATDADGVTTYAVVRAGTRVKVTEGAELPDDVVDAQYYRFAGIVDGVTAADAEAQMPRALYYDKTAMTFVCLDRDGNYYKQWPEDFAPMAAYVVSPGGEPIAGKLFWSEDEEAFYYYSAAEWYRVEDTYVRNDVAKISDTLSEYMSAGYLTAPFPSNAFGVNDDFTASNDEALKDGEIIPWTGWLTLVLCYQTSDSAAKVKLTGYAGPTLGKRELIGETAVAASEAPRVVRITGEHDYNPGRNGASDACMVGSGYHVNVEVQSPNAKFTLLWAVVYESDPYGNPRRRGGSIRRFYEQMNTVNIPFTNTERGDRGLYMPRYNERTGWFELNGLTDVTWATMEAIAADTEFNTVYPCNFSRKANIRTNKVGPHHWNTRGGVGDFLMHYYKGMEVVAMPSPGYNMAQISVNNSSFGNCGNLFAILMLLEIRFDKFMELSTEIETCYLMPITTLTELSMKDQAKMSWDSINWMINVTSGRTSDLTVTVHADVYAKMTGGTVDDWGSLGTLAEEKGVKLVAYGESGYPFLTRVLWHGYKRLENKINAAKSGDVIYIHPEDRQKITSAQKDDWAALVTAGAEKRITFAQAE